jgi:hypothetical protein
MSETQTKTCFLVEPGVKEAMRALLVKRLEESHGKLECQFVGSMYCHPPVQVDAPDTQVTIANAQDTEVAAQDHHKIDSEMKVCKGKTKDEHSHPLCVEEEDGKPPLVRRGPELQQSQI